MFLRRQGRRVVFLHSYRDGRGKVCHRRLGHVEEREGLERLLEAEGWSQWRADLQGRYPELHVDWDRLRVRAEVFLREGLALAPRLRKPVRESQSLAAVQRGKSLQGMARSLVNRLCRESDPLVLQLARPELEELSAWLRPNSNDGDLRTDGDLRPIEITSVDNDRESLEMAGLTRWLRGCDGMLASTRRRYTEVDPVVQPYLRRLERINCYLQDSQRWLDSSRVLQRLIECCPCPRYRLEYGALLHRLGRYEDAMEQYRFLPLRDHRRHYNVAAVAWLQGHPDLCLWHILRGMTRAEDVGYALGGVAELGSTSRAQRYEQEYGHLWSSSAREFLGILCRQMVVRFFLRRARERGVLRRELLPASTRARLLETVLKKMPESSEEVRRP